MEIIQTTGEMRQWAASTRGQGATVALVPTMGFFHEGHMALMRRARQLADQVVVSLFVNPTQFAPGEDLDAYPRAFERDCTMADEMGVTALFCPGPEDMYPAGFQTTVTVAELTRGLCGQNRPHHFAGVTTVVAKLFNLCQPHVAVFGEKDFQQLAVIRRMVRDLNMPIDVVGHPIVREHDGLAMSSRNAYLSASQRQQALCLWHAIEKARKTAEAGELDCRKITQMVHDVIVSHGPCHIDYIELINKDTLERSSTIDANVFLAMAVKIGTTRLIDNSRLLHGEESNV